ncbi:hypothetical protein ACF0H5_006836 [Mactra antiquata]
MSLSKWKRVVASVSHTSSRSSKKYSSTLSLDKSHQKTIETLQYNLELWEREKQELKGKLSELEEYQDKYEQEKKENELLQMRIQDLLSGQSDATKNLMRTNEAVDKLRLDQRKKIELIEKLQSDVRFKDDRIRNLEIRASEVEKAELILETTKNNLEQTVQQVRVRDNEIKRLDKEVDDHKRQLDSANQRIKDLEEKMEDMKIQVRHEIMKNENIEKNLETIPRLKDTIKEREDEIKDLKKHIEEKNALLTAARKAVREYKDKLRYSEHEISRTEKLKQDLEMSQCEIQSLKCLMYGKDYLVTQKTKALDLSKEIIGVLNDPTEYEQNRRIQHLLDRLSEGATSTRSPSTRSTTSVLQSSSSEQDFRCVSAPPPKSYPQSGSQHRDIDVNNPPYGMEPDHYGNQNGDYSNDKYANKRFLNQVSVEMPDKRKRPVSSANPTVRRSASMVHRTSSLREAKKVYDKPLPRKCNGYEAEVVQSPRQQNRIAFKTDKQSNSKYKPALECNLGDDTKHDNKSGENDEKGQLPSDADSVFSSESDFEDEAISEQEYVTRGFSAKDKDILLSDIINVGDRVLISCPQKPPKYGKKRVLKPINYTGIVKFKGKLNPDKYDARIHVGIRMDDQVGDTDGTYKGKRLMYTPLDQGKFFKIRDLTSVLNIKTGRYIPVQRLIVHQLHKQQRSESRNEH